jgi:serine/threonine protein kinase
MTWLSNDAVQRLRDVAVWPALPADRYVIEAPIGRGGMGTVYAARDVQLDRRVAIKVANAVARGSALDERLNDEARILARLEHPGIVPIHDAGVLDDGRAFYVMKLVRGDTLTAYAASLTTEAARLAVFERVTEAVAFAHTAGVVHRDLKPSNVMVGAFGEVLVLDWGLANAPGVAGAGRGGTPGFMAPEQHRTGPPHLVGPAADVFSLGALLFWLLTAETLPQTADAVDRRLAGVTPAPPVRLRAIVRKCLAPDPADRYGSAADLAADVAAYRSGLPVTAHRDTWLERAAHWFATYRTFILLIAAYLLMRAALAWFQRP